MEEIKNDENSKSEAPHVGSETKPTNEKYYAQMPIGFDIYAPNLSSARAQMTAMAKGLSILPSIRVEWLRAVLYQDHTQVFPMLPDHVPVTTCCPSFRVRVHWDLDFEEGQTPDNVPEVVDVPHMYEEQVTEYLTDKYGWCVLAWRHYREEEINETRK